MQSTVRGGFDTFALSAKPGKEFGENKFLRLNSAAAEAFLYLRNPVPRNATVHSATLYLRARDASTGARTITVRKVSGSWKAGRLTWNNKPGATGASVTAAVGALADGDLITFDVTAHVQDWASGTAHYGWQITTNATALHKVYGLDSGKFQPRLVVDWSDAPGVPTDLVPAGVVSVAKPVVAFTYNDGDQDALSALQVQIDAAANGTTPGFDSGEVASTTPELDLSTTLYAGLAVAATTQWRVRVKDAGGLWSEWSDWASFTRTAKSTLTLDNPAVAPNDFVSEPTPPIMWTFAGTQTAYRVRILDNNGERYDSGKLPGTAASHMIPQKWQGRRVLVDDSTRTVEVRVWDNVNRVHTRNDPTYVAVSRAFTVNDSAGTAAPTAPSAVQDGISPAVLFSFTRTTAPDSFNILRDGEVIDAEVDPVDIFTTGTTYTYRDPSATPGRPHVYAARAVVNGVQSQKATATAVTTDVRGSWLVSADAEILLLDFELNVRSLDQAATYLPLGSESHVRTIAGVGALIGDARGSLVAAAGVDIPTALDALEAMQDDAATPVRLISEDFSHDVLLGDLTTAPHRDSGRGLSNRVVAVSFNFWSA